MGLMAADMALKETASRCLCLRQWVSESGILAVFRRVNGLLSSVSSSWRWVILQL
jgi:hypothetical protein